MSRMTAFSKGVLFAVALAIVSAGSAASEMGATLCEDWELAGRTYYQGRGDKTFEFYEEANRWIIGHVLGSPRWSGSKAHAIVEGYFRGTTRDPNAVLTDVLTEITTKALEYCRKHPSHSIATATDMLLRTK